MADDVKQTAKCGRNEIQRNSLRATANRPQTSCRPVRTLQTPGRLRETDFIALQHSGRNSTINSN